MGLQSSSSVATTIAVLDAAGIAIVRHEEGWFIEDYQHMAGPYNAPEIALEASVHWLTELQMRQIGAGVSEDS